MNDSTVFRTKQNIAAQAEEVLPTGKEPSQGSIADIEVPYLDYETQHNHPLSVDHFKLGDSWNDPVGGFPNEIATIERYIKGKVHSGEIANNTPAIQEYIKKLEKVNNVHTETRSLVKIETLAAYIEFLQKTDQLKSNLRRYANS